MSFSLHADQQLEYDIPKLLQVLGVTEAAEEGCRTIPLSLKAETGRAVGRAGSRLSASHPCLGVAALKRDLP